MKGRRIPYNAEELAWLEERHDWPRAVLREVFAVLFGRPDVKLDDVKALCSRKGWRTGRTGCFEKGSTPSNKGRACPPGRGGRHPNAVRTQFKPGGRTGRAAAVYKPIGAERLSKEGYLERKIHDGMPFQSRWRAVHIIEWERVNGPIPKAHCLKCLDGNKANTDPSNWELIHRAVLARLNGGPHKRSLAYDEASPELRPTVLVMAKLGHRASELAGSRGRR